MLRYPRHGSVDLCKTSVKVTFEIIEAFIRLVDAAHSPQFVNSRVVPAVGLAISVAVLLVFVHVAAHSVRRALQVHGTGLPTCSALAPVYPVEIGDLEWSTGVVLTAQLKVALGGSFTEACEA